MGNSDKTILLTGASGFLGTYIKSELVKCGFKIITIGRSNTNIVHDFNEGIPIINEKIDYLVHAGGKAHLVPKSKKEKDSFFEINHNGTMNLLEGIKKSGSALKSIVFISSVAVYGLTEGKNIEESYPLNGSDSYGRSKVLTEKLIEEFCLDANINFCILRLPLVAGKNPPGNLGSMIRSLNKGTYFSIGKANVKKSIVMAEDVAKLIPDLFYKSGIYNLTDGYHPTFDELEKAIAAAINKKNPLKIHQSLAWALAKTGDLLGKKSPINSDKLKKIRSELTFSDKKATLELGWKPRKVIDNIDKLV